MMKNKRDPHVHWGDFHLGFSRINLLSKTIILSSNTKRERERKSCFVITGFFQLKRGLDDEGIRIDKLT